MTYEPHCLQGQGTHWEWGPGQQEQDVQEETDRGTENKNKIVHITVSHLLHCIVLLEHTALDMRNTFCCAFSGFKMHQLF